MYLTSHKIFVIYDKKNQSRSLADRAIHLLEGQRRSWPQLAEGYAALASVKTRDVACGGFSVVLQYNPGRMVSTTADVGRGTVEGRECFLCLGNLPPPQKGILYHDQFLVLCNPAPICENHFTVSHLQHVPQSFQANIDTFFHLARDFGSRFTVLYNGPRCGASAPDHMHFQALPGESIPVLKDLMDESRRKVFLKRKQTTGLTLDRYGRTAIAFESSDTQELQAIVLNAVESIKSVLSSREEPMLNIFCSFLDEQWRVILFPRAKHRPDVFFKEEGDRVLISPAAVEMGGLIVTPLEKDFQSVDAPAIEKIFLEVSLEKKIVSAALSRV